MKEQEPRSVTNAPGLPYHQGGVWADRDICWRPGGYMMHRMSLPPSFLLLNCNLSLLASHTGCASVSFSVHTTYFDQVIYLRSRPVCSTILTLVRAHTFFLLPHREATKGKKKMMGRDVYRVDVCQEKALSFVGWNQLMMNTILGR